MKRGAKLGFAFVGGALVLAAISRGKSNQGPIVAYPVDLGGGGPGPQQATPSPPTQGNGFRMGPQPDPAAPGDPNRGRNFVIMTQSRQSGTEAEGSIALFDLPSSARGRVSVRVWATRAGKPQRCSRWVGSANVVDGRMVWPPTWQAPRPAICGTEHATATDAGGCSLGLPFVELEQQGPTVGLVWRTKVNAGSIWSDNDCDEDLRFYVDAFWKWEPA